MVDHNSWCTTGFCAGSTPFLVHVNDLTLSSDAKLFADDTSLFAIAYDENIAAEQLNNDLNNDSQKRIKPTHPPFYFNKNQVVIKREQKHLSLILDSGLTFLSYLREKIISTRRGICVIRFLSKYVSRDVHVLDQMYKPFVRPHLDYGEHYLSQI